MRGCVGMKPPRGATAGRSALPRKDGSPHSQMTGHSANTQSPGSQSVDAHGWLGTARPAGVTEASPLRSSSAISSAECGAGRCIRAARRNSGQDRKKSALFSFLRQRLSHRHASYSASCNSPLEAPLAGGMAFELGGRLAFLSHIFCSWAVSGPAFVVDMQEHCPR